MHAGYEVATYHSAQPLLDGLPSAGEPGCILLDVRIPGMSGPELQARLSELGSTLPIIFLTGHAGTPTIVRTLKAGALDFLTKPVASHDLLAAVAKALRDHEALLDQQRLLDGIRARIGTLTPRERQVFDLIIRGNTNKAIGFALDCTERTSRRIGTR